MTETCPVCRNEMNQAFSGVILKKNKVEYFFCKTCGLLKTEKPYWLAEVYRQAIAETDTGLLQRNIANSKMVEPILHCLFKGKGRFLDVAGGYGVLTRLLRDMGFDCYSMDQYCQNLFAKAFDPDDGFRANAIFAFEVLEHIKNPREFLKDLFDTYSCKTIIFSTLTFSGDIPKKNWWYYAFETGQHISFYQPRTIVFLASTLGCRYYRLGPELHLMTDMRLPGFLRMVLTHRFVRKLFALSLHWKRKRISRTWSDHLLLKSMNGSVIEKQPPKPAKGIET
ncbi:MAG: class I SAM-dependent methyltransferase [Chrysiogenia bacterium]